MAQKRKPFPRSLSSRDVGSNVLKLSRQSYSLPSFIDRLGLECELQGHLGCVNCLQWNSGGTLLASGSDDQTVKLWEPHRQRLRHSFHTGHSQNIFSVKFIPMSGDHLVASGAADFQVRLHDFSKGEVARIWNCHRARVKRLDVAPGEPSLLWSCAEDGTVRQLDFREAHQCSSGSACANTIVALGPRRAQCLREIKCLAINPVHTHLLAVGCGDGIVRVYDRRRMAPLSAEDLSADEDRNCLAWLCPGHLQSAQANYKPLTEFVAVTYVAWSPSGRDLLANIARDQVFLFDMWQPRPVVPDYCYCIPASQSDAVCHHNPEWNEVAAFSQGNALFSAKHLSAAVGLFVKGVHEHRHHPAAYVQLAHALQRRSWPGDCYAALKAVREAAALQPQSSAAAMRVLHAYTTLGWWAAAKECAEDFERRFPQQCGQQEYRSLCRKVAENARREGSSHPQPSNGENLPSSFREYQNLCYRIAEGCQFDGPPKGAEHVKHVSHLTDFVSHFCGHCNMSTDIKEANFLDPEGRYIIAGSDDGMIFIWDRNSTQLVRALHADSNIVNCLQPHPSQCLLASSGIDSAVRLWSPQAKPRMLKEVPSISRGEALLEDLGALTTDTMEETASVNQWRMFAVPFDVLLHTLGYPLVQ